MPQQRRKRKLDIDLPSSFEQSVVNKNK